MLMSSIDTEATTKVVAMASVPDKLKGKLSAKGWIKFLEVRLNGKGGGSDTTAQLSGTNVGAILDAVQLARKYAADTLGLSTQVNEDEKLEKSAADKGVLQGASKVQEFCAALTGSLSGGELKVQQNALKDTKLVLEKQKIKLDGGIAALWCFAPRKFLGGEDVVTSAQVRYFVYQLSLITIGVSVTILWWQQ